MEHERNLNIQGMVGHSFGASAILNCIHKDKHAVRLVLISPALKVRDTLDSTITSHGVPNSIFNSLIKKYEDYYGYNLKNDDPINLIKEIDQEILIYHDKGDRATPFKDSESACEINDRIKLLSTNGYGHARILKSDRVVMDCVDYISNSNTNHRELSA